MNNFRNENARPSIRMIEAESTRLTYLALKAEARSPNVAALLLGEIARAELGTESELPADIVTMGADVEFLDERSGTRRTVRLVYPPDADIDAGRISILTPVGAGLIGLQAGQSILWPDREGRDRALRILSVTRPAGHPALP